MPAVPTGTSIRYEVRFEDRFSDGDYSDWTDSLGPISGWADIGSSRYVLNGDNWRFMGMDFSGERWVSFALTGLGPLTPDGDFFEGIFIHHSSFTGWHGDDALGYGRPLPNGAVSDGYRNLSGTTTVTPVSLPGTGAFSLTGLVLLGRLPRHQRWQAPRGLAAA